MSGAAAGEALEAPDVAGTIEAWRVWRVVGKHGDYCLGSVIKSTLWPLGEPLSAECLHVPQLLGWLVAVRHGAPDPACECGIYAAGPD